MKNHFIALSIVCLGLCFVIGSWLIARGISENAANVKELSRLTAANEKVEKPLLLNQDELAAYLGISVEEVRILSPVTTDGSMFESPIPYIQIGNVVYFSKAAVDLWLQKNETSFIQ
ncbi:helix-turn-helix domain-containing protein [Neobacillus soli]|uniref:helix-turn-helix domain-containing protein n=1 Tax=Neobacillus soli TaxID=220688 RepID=UPI000825F5B7|nr:helix-turn-helix domain-containing protein [Neobacillus soli]